MATLDLAWTVYITARLIIYVIRGHYVDDSYLYRYTIHGSLMAGATRNSKNRQGEPIPPEMDPTGVFEAFEQRMVQLGGTNNNIAPIRPLHGSKVLGRFRALRPEKFNGMNDPSKAEQWLREMDLIFDTIECSD